MKGNTFIRTRRNVALVSLRGDVGAAWFKIATQCGTILVQNCCTVFLLPAHNTLHFTALFLQRQLRTWFKEVIFKDFMKN